MQPTFKLLFAAASHLRGPLRKQTFTSVSCKDHGVWFLNGGFFFSFCIFLCLKVRCRVPVLLQSSVQAYLPS